MSISSLAVTLNALRLALPAGNRVAAQVQAQAPLVAQVAP
jgi:hypothetical protein